MRKVFFILFCFVLISLLIVGVLYFYFLYLDWKNIYEATDTIRNMKLMNWHKTLFIVSIGFSLFMGLNVVIIGNKLFLLNTKDVLNYLISIVSAIIVFNLYFLFSKDLNAPSLVTYGIIALPYLFSIYELLWYFHFQPSEH